MEEKVEEEVEVLFPCVMWWRLTIFSCLYIHLYIMKCVLAVPERRIYVTLSMFCLPCREASIVTASKISFTRGSEWNYYCGEDILNSGDVILWLIDLFNFWFYVHSLKMHFILCTRVCVLQYVFWGKSKTRNIHVSSNFPPPHPSLPALSPSPHSTKRGGRLLYIM